VISITNTVGSAVIKPETGRLAAFGGLAGLTGFYSEPMQNGKNPP